MRSLLYVIAVILVIAWALGQFAWHAGGIIYVLLVLAVASFLLGVIRKENI
ncbi:MAG: family rane protein [Flavipsychrobacter sp.]|nr:family rane protein [Flavipsychrobacter sp.]